MLHHFSVGTLKCTSQLCIRPSFPATSFVVYLCFWFCHFQNGITMCNVHILMYTLVIPFWFSLLILQYFHFTLAIILVRFDSVNTLLPFENDQISLPIDAIVEMHFVMFEMNDRIKNESDFYMQKDKDHSNTQCIFARKSINFH